jgi:hypothetical protein
MKKPPIPDHRDATFSERVRDALLILLGRKGNRIEQLFEKKRAVSASYTQAEIEAIRDDVLSTRKKVNELLELLHGPY